MPTYQAGKIVETIALGLLATIFSTILAIPVSFLAARNITARIPGGTVIYYAMRNVLNIVRAIDTLIWGLIVVLWVGLGSFAAVIALTIHSVAALGKLFSEEIEHIDPGPIEAVTSTGANLIQTIRYAVIPQIVPPFLGYTLLRWDINMRSATIVGYGGRRRHRLLRDRDAAQERLRPVRRRAVGDRDRDHASWTTSAPGGASASRSAPRRSATGKPRPFYTSPRAWFYIVLGAAAFCLLLEPVRDRSAGRCFEPAPTFLALITSFVSFNLAPEVTQRGRPRR